MEAVNRSGSDGSKPKKWKQAIKMVVGKRSGSAGSKPNKRYKEVGVGKRRECGGSGMEIDRFHVPISNR